MSRKKNKRPLRLEYVEAGSLDADPAGPPVRPEPRGSLPDYPKPRVDEACRQLEQRQDVNGDSLQLASTHLLCSVRREGEARYACADSQRASHLRVVRSDFFPNDNAWFVVAERGPMLARASGGGDPLGVYYQLMFVPGVVDEAKPFIAAGLKGFVGIGAPWLFQASFR